MTDEALFKVDEPTLRRLVGPPRLVFTVDHANGKFALTDRPGTTITVGKMVPLLGLWLMIRRQTAGRRSAFIAQLFHGNGRLLLEYDVTKEGSYFLSPYYGRFVPQRVANADELRALVEQYKP